MYLWDVRQFVVGFHGNSKIPLSIVPANDGNKWNWNACLVGNSVSIMRNKELSTTCKNA